MNRYKLSKAGISAKDGIERFNGNTEIYEKYLHSFLEDKTFSEMCDAIEKKDIHSAFVAAHSLKGVAGNLSMVKLYDDICPLVEELRSDSLENAQQLLKSVMEDYELIITTLNETV